MFIKNLQANPSGPRVILLLKGFYFNRYRMIRVVLFLLESFQSLYESLLITMWALVVCVFQEFVYFIYCGKVVYYPFNVSSICSDAFCFHFYYWRVLSFVFTSLFPGLSKVLLIFSKIQPFIAFKNTFPISLIPALYYLFLYVLGLNKFYYDFFRYKIRSLIWDLSPFSFSVLL